MTLPINIPRRVSANTPVKAEWGNAVRECLIKLAEAVKPKLQNAVIGVPAGDDGPPCPFGEVYTYEVDDEMLTGIRGGWIQAGDKTWWMEPFEIDPETDSEKLYWIRIGVTANTDPDGVAVLSGLETSTEPEWESGPVGSGFPDSTIPDIFPTTSPGEGEYIIAIGYVLVSDG